MKNTLDEEQIVSLLWKTYGRPRGVDPFDDDVSWVKSQSKKYLIAKSDMLVAITDSPMQMTPDMISRKAIVSCVSDFSAKGVKPDYCLVSIGMPKSLANRNFLTRLARGFDSAEREYKVRIIGGDTNASRSDLVIDCTLFGFSDSLVRRRGAKPGDLVGTTGTFGHQSSGIYLLLEKAKSEYANFKSKAIESVLRPRARLEIGLLTAPYLTSCIDSSDGLALSLYHLAESSRVNITLDTLPTSQGVESFAHENHLRTSDLVLFGGEEYELVFTFRPEKLLTLTRLGIKTIGRVDSHSTSPLVKYNEKKIQRKGWIHFQS